MRVNVVGKNADFCVAKRRCSAAEAFFKRGGLPPKRGKSPVPSLLVRPSSRVSLLDRIVVKTAAGPKILAIVNEMCYNKLKWCGDHHPQK